MILALNLLALLAVFANKNNRDKLKIVCTVVLLQFLAYPIAYNIDDAFAYYATCGIFDLLTIYAIGKFRASRFALIAQIITFTSLLNNVIGYVVYELGGPAVWYDTILSFILCIQTIYFVKKNYNHDCSGSNVDGWNDCASLTDIERNAQEVAKCRR